MSSFLTKKIVILLMSGLDEAKGEKIDVGMFPFPHIFYNHTVQEIENIGAGKIF